MEQLNKYSGEIVERRIEPYEMPPEAGSGGTEDLVAAVLRRWQLVVLLFAAICAAGLLSVWLLIEPAYEVTGALRVAPILPNILTGEADKGEISNYQSFMNTQAKMILSPQVMQRVADDLAGRNLAFFEEHARGLGGKLARKINPATGKPDAAQILKGAISEGLITATASRNTELVEIMMLNSNPEDGRKIVDAFIQAYMLVEVASSLQGQDQRLTVLENERKVLAGKLENQREAIRKLAEEYGTATLGGRQDMMLQRVSNLLGELTKAEAVRIGLEARVQALGQEKEHAALTEEMLQKRNDFVNADVAVKELTRNVVQLEQDMIMARQTLTPENPVLKQKEDFLAAFKKRQDERRVEVAKEFDEKMAVEANEAVSARLVSARAELEQTQMFENRLREKLANEDTKTIEVGRKQLAIQDLQYQLDLDKETYDRISRRIQELEMERKRPARVSIAYPADVVGIRDKRLKYSLAIVFGAMACGMGAAIVADKADRRLRCPEDIVRHIGVRILGTTANPQTIKSELLPRQLLEDYQTIRANLGLLDGGGIPRKVVITSPAMRDGKTTFAVNLATSLSRAGKRVLLIDGDLRKPDIGRLLNIPREARRLQELLAFKDLEEGVWAAPSGGLDVLAADSHSPVDPYELLTLPRTAEQIAKLSERYDHVIIDTPPVLAFPDALIWARIAGAVILTSFAGRTTGPDLKVAKQRLSEMGVTILGSVLSNVGVDHSYYRYGYHYYASGPHRHRSEKGTSVRPLLFSTETEDKKDNQAKS